MKNLNKFLEDNPHSIVVNYINKQNIFVRLFGIRRNTRYNTPNGTKVFFGRYYSLFGHRYWYKNTVVTVYNEGEI